MTGKFGTIFVAVLLLMNGLFAQPQPTDISMVGSAFLENRSYRVLEKICDEAGGRLVGSENNRKAMALLKEELAGIGLQPTSEPFRMPGWIRGEDSVVMVAPVHRRLKAVALGYVDRTPAFDAEMVFAGHGFAGDYQSLDPTGKIVLVTSEKPRGKSPLMRLEVIRIAAGNGARAVLFINNKKGGLNLAGVSDFQGNPSAIPAFSLTYEEGKWLQRLAEKGERVRLRIAVNSRCREIETANTVVRFPGETDRKIVLGAHFDSWDLGQGGIDNGLGTAILFDVARLMHRYSPHNYYSVELVWFNGEELGLWGSKKYLERHGSDQVLAMINMDMTGSPTGLNAMGFDELLPVLRQWLPLYNGLHLSRGVINQPWTNSDHMPFMLRGIPTISLTAHLDSDMGRYYHSFGDTFDKVNRKYLSEAAAVVSVLLRHLANDRSLTLRHLSDEETAEMLMKHQLDDRLKREGEWPFDIREPANRH